LDVLTPNQVHCTTKASFFLQQLWTRPCTNKHKLQVEWQPYDRRDVRDLNMAPYVQAEKVLWRANVPMIFYYVVEHHLPQRVMKQFGSEQNFPLQHESTTHQLHE
jgi:hypothetical protein